jgi:hypothetical protein
MYVTGKCKEALAQALAVVGNSSIVACGAATYCGRRLRDELLALPDRIRNAMRHGGLVAPDFKGLRGICVVCKLRGVQVDRWRDIRMSEWWRIRTDRGL